MAFPSSLAQLKNMALFNHTARGVHIQGEAQQKPPSGVAEKCSSEETFKERLQILSSSWAIANSDAWNMQFGVGSFIAFMVIAS